MLTNKGLCYTFNAGDDIKAMATHKGICTSLCTFITALSLKNIFHIYSVNIASVRVHHILTPYYHRPYLSQPENI